jgi:hypothetical protein
MRRKSLRPKPASRARTIVSDRPVTPSLLITVDTSAKWLGRHAAVINFAARCIALATLSAFHHAQTSRREPYKRHQRSC